MVRAREVEQHHAAQLDGCILDGEVALAWSYGLGLYT